MAYRNESAIGNCYESSLILFLNLQKQNQDGIRRLLCHGIAIQTIPPHIEMGHAWIEENWGGEWYVADALYPFNRVPREKYYELGKINPASVKRYTKQQSAHLAKQAESCGPWDARIASAAHSNE